MSIDRVEGSNADVGVETRVQMAEEHESYLTPFLDSI